MWKDRIFDIGDPLERIWLETRYWRASIKELDIRPGHRLVKIKLVGIFVNLERTAANRDVGALNYAFLLSHLNFGGRENAFPKDLLVYF